VAWSCCGLVVLVCASPRVVAHGSRSPRRVDPHRSRPLTLIAHIQRLWPGRVGRCGASRRLPCPGLAHGGLPQYQQALPLVGHVDCLRHPLRWPAGNCADLVALVAASPRVASPRSRPPRLAWCHSRVWPGAIRGVASPRSPHSRLAHAESCRSPRSHPAPVGWSRRLGSYRWGASRREAPVAHVRGLPVVAHVCRLWPGLVALLAFRALRSCRRRPPALFRS
jgi:hypothetical protein